MKIISGFLSIGILVFATTFATRSYAQDSYALPPLKIDSAQTLVQAKKINADIDTWLAKLKIPQQFDFASNCESYFESSQAYGLEYDPLTHLLNYQGLERYPLEHHETFLAHEYGHVVFRANIARVSKDLDDDLNGSLVYRELLRQSLKQTGETSCESLAENAAALRAERKKLQDNSYFTFYAIMLGAYDELFADIIAVLYTGRGDAVYQAVGGAKVNWGLKYYIDLPTDYRGRDFTYRVPAEGWRRDSPNMHFYDMLGSLSDFYNALDPARSYLWENYLQALPRDRYGDFIAAYLDAVAPEFQRYVDEQIWDASIEEMNVRFIRSIDLQMQLHKIPKTK